MYKAIRASRSKEGATTVMVTLVLVLSPSSSVARNVTVVLPSPRVRLELVPLATTSPPTSHELDATLPSESVAVAVKDTVSPAAPSVSSIVRFPSEMDTAGAALNALSLMPKEFNEVGMLPLRELLSRLSLIKFVRFPSSEGMRPVRELSLR